MEQYRAFESYCELGDDLPCLDSCVQIPTEQNLDEQVTSDAVIAALPTYRVWKTSPFVLPEYECGLCLEKFREGDYVKCLPCKHKFHTFCIENWLKWVRSRCPVDKVAVCRYVYEDPNYVIEEDIELRSESFIENNGNIGHSSDPEQTRLCGQPVQNSSVKSTEMTPSDTKIICSSRKVESSSQLFKKHYGRKAAKGPASERATQEDFSYSNAKLNTQKGLNNRSQNFRGKVKTTDPAVLRENQKSSFVEERQRKVKSRNSSSKQISSRLLKLSEPRKSAENLCYTTHPWEIPSPTKACHSDTVTCKLKKSWDSKKYENLEKDTSLKPHVQDHFSCSNVELNTLKDLDRHSQRNIRSKAEAMDSMIQMYKPKSLIFEELCGQRKRKEITNSPLKQISSRLLKLSQPRRSQANLVYTLRPLEIASVTRTSYSDTTTNKTLKPWDSEKYEYYGSTNDMSRSGQFVGSRATHVGKFRSISAYPGKRIQSSDDAVSERREHNESKTSISHSARKGSLQVEGRTSWGAGVSSSNLPQTESQYRYATVHREHSRQVDARKTPLPRKKSLTPQQVLRRCGQKTDSQILRRTPVVSAAGKIKPPFNRF